MKDASQVCLIQTEATAGGSTEKKADEKVKKESFSANTVQGMMEAYSSIYNTEETQELQENRGNRGITPCCSCSKGIGKHW